MKLRYWIFGAVAGFSIVYFVFAFISNFILPPKTATDLMKRYQGKFVVFSITVPPGSITSMLKRLEYPPVIIRLNESRPKEPFYELLEGKEYYQSGTSSSRNMPEKIVRDLNNWSTSHPQGSATLVIVPAEARFLPEKGPSPVTTLSTYDSKLFLASSGTIETEEEIIYVSIIGDKIVEWKERPFAW